MICGEEKYHRIKWRWKKIIRRHTNTRKVKGCSLHHFQLCWFVFTPAVPLQVKFGITGTQEADQKGHNQCVTRKLRNQSPISSSLLLLPRARPPYALLPLLSPLSFLTPSLLESVSSLLPPVPQSSSLPLPSIHLHTFTLLLFPSFSPPLSLTLPSTHPGDDVDTAEQQLVEVAISHQLGAMDERVLETRPDLPPQLRRHVQLHTQVPQSHTGQVVNLSTQTYSLSTCVFHTSSINPLSTMTYCR